MKNSSKAFEASLSFGFTEKHADYSLEKADLLIEKYAGITIYQPTIDNVETFVHKYALNEISGVAYINGLSIHFRPSSFNSQKPEYVEDGQGSVSVAVGDVTLEIPFLVIDGDLIPFDIIQLDKQRVPYTRENLRKILDGIHNDKKMNAPIKDFDPYVKVDKPINPTSSIGFLGDVLRIQEQHINRTTSGGNIYVTSAAKLEDALEKLANMQPLTSDDWKKMEDVVRDAVLDVELKQLSKEAEELMASNDTAYASIFNKVKDIPFVDANSLPHGTIVAFPEIHNREISMNKGIILDDYMDMAGFMPSKIKVIVSNDARMKILTHIEKFMCLPIDGMGFKLHTHSIASVDSKEIIIAFDGNKALVPCRINYVRSRSLSGKEDTYYGDETTPRSTATGKSGVKIYDLTPIYNDDEAMAVFSDDGVGRESHIFDNHVDLKLTLLDGAKFHEIPYNEFIKRKAEELGIEEMQMMGLCQRYDVATRKEKNVKSIDSHYGRTVREGNTVFCTSDDTKVVIIKGLITGYLKKPDDLERMANSVMNKNEFEIGKVAGEVTDTPTTPVQTKKIDANKMDAVDASDANSNDFNLNQVNSDTNPPEFRLSKGEGDVEIDNKKTQKTAGAGEVADVALKAMKAKAHNLATKDWSVLKSKGLLSPDETRVIKPYNHMGVDMKEKTIDTVKSNYEKMLQKDVKASKMADVDEFEIFKSASQNEYVEIRSVDRDKETFEVKVSHIDKSKKIFKNLNRVFRNVPYAQVREILRAIGFGLPKVSEIMSRASRENYVHYELPEDATPQKLVGGQVVGSVSQSMQKIKNTVFDSGISDALAAEVLGALLAGAVMSSGTGRTVFDATKKFAGEATALSGEFEKVAIERRSQSMLEVAKVMAVAAHMNEKVANVVNGSAQYFKLNDAIKDVLEAKPLLEKVATDLIDLKVAQYRNKNEIINMGYVQAAIKQVDHLYRMACCLDNYTK